MYEKEYMRQEWELEEMGDVPGVRREGREGGWDMKNLFAKLETLPHFHFTPKPVNPEVEIICNVPTIAMERVRMRSSRGRISICRFQE